jgi:hypothetical protein
MLLKFPLLRKVLSVSDPFLKEKKLIIHFGGSGSNISTPNVDKMKHRRTQYAVNDLLLVVSGSTMDHARKIDSFLK